MKTTNETKQSICTLVQRSRHNPWSALGCGVLTPSSSSPGSLRTQYAWSQRHHDPITSSFQPINCVIKCLTLTMFSVTSSSSSSRPSTDLLSSLAALASAGLVSAGGPATVKGKKSNQQQSDHLICEVRVCSEHFSSPVSQSRCIFSSPVSFFSRFAARGRASTVTTAVRSARAVGPSSGDPFNPGD